MPSKIPAMANRHIVDVNGQGAFSSLKWARLPYDKIKKNRYVYIIWSSTGSKAALLYAPLSNDIFAIDNFREEYLYEQEWVAKFLGFVSEQEIDEDSLTKDPDFSDSTHFSIGISDRCNLNCAYCHAEATGRVVKNRLSLLELDRICAIIMDRMNGQNKASVSFSCGGEPTLEWDRFVYTVNKLRSSLSKSNVGLSLSMTTNGMYGDKKRRFIADNFTSVTLSLDGISKIQNKQRPLHGGTGSYDRVIGTAEFFSNSGLPFGFRSTVCQEGLGGLTDFVKLMSRKFSPVVISFEPVVQIGRAVDMEFESVHPWQFCQMFWEAYSIGKTLGVDVRTSMLNIKQLRATFCGAMAIPSVTFAPSGGVTACHRDARGDYQYGKVNDSSGKFEVSASAMKNVRNLSRLPEHCEDCFCRWTCGGDCPDIRGVESRCNMIRELTFRGLSEALN